MPVSFRLWVKFRVIAGFHLTGPVKNGNDKATHDSHHCPLRPEIEVVMGASARSAWSLAC
jgi:hypothetical protein